MTTTFFTNARLSDGRLLDLTVRQGKFVAMARAGETSAPADAVVTDKSAINPVMTLSVQTTDFMKSFRVSSISVKRR